MKLSEVITLQRGFDLPNKDRVKGSIPVIGSNGVVGFHGESKVVAPVVTIGRSGVIGGAIYTNVDCWPLNTTLFVKDYKGNNPRWVYFLLKSIDFSGFNSGTAQPSLNRNYIADLQIEVPPLYEQRAIAEVLSSLDDQIELLTKQNETLQALLMAYFKKLCSTSSEYLPLGKIADISIGRTPPRKEAFWFSSSSDDVPWLSVKDMGHSDLHVSSTQEYLTEDAIKQFNIKVVPSGTIVLSFKLTVGRISITDVPMATNEAIAHLINPILPVEYLLAYLLSYDFNQLGSTSSIATAVNSQILRKDLLVLVPSKMELEEYLYRAKPVLSKMNNNSRLKKRLQITRDALLPQLMSGALRVADAKHLVSKEVAHGQTE